MIGIRAVAKGFAKIIFDKKEIDLSKAKEMAIIKTNKHDVDVGPERPTDPPLLSFHLAPLYAVLRTWLFLLLDSLSRTSCQPSSNLRIREVRR